jgi:dTDP-4-dehydrorhamnose reductase
MKTFVAPRPRHTVMSTSKLSAVTGTVPRPWQDALDEYLARKLKGQILSS